MKLKQVIEKLTAIQQKYPGDDHEVAVISTIADYISVIEDVVEPGEKESDKTTLIVHPGL